MAIPQHSRYLVERLLQAYCARICPPTATHTVLLRYAVDDTDATIYESRALLGVNHLRLPIPVARFTYDEPDKLWLLEYRGESGWHLHSRLHQSRSFVELLREFDADPLGEFWGRIDGKSLRWCRSAGRCQDCESRYAEILGLGANLTNQRSTKETAISSSTPARTTFART